MFMPYFLISTNLLFQTLTHRKKCHANTPAPYFPAPPCHPERRAKPEVEPVRATAGRNLQSSSALTSTPNFRPSCHPERRAKPGVEPGGRPQVGIYYGRAHYPCAIPRNGKTPGQLYPYPLSESLLKGVRGKLFSRKVSPASLSLLTPPSAY